MKTSKSLKVQKSRRKNPHRGIGGALDRVIGVFDPVRVGKRMAAREANQRLSSRYYDGAARDRTTADWNPRTGTKDAELAADLPTLIARSRDVVRNTSAGRAVVRAYGRNVVGCGLTPSADAVDDAGNSLEKFNERVDRDFADWAENALYCDVEKRLPLWEQEEQAVCQAIEVGEFYMHFTVVDNPGRSPSRLRLQRLEVDSLNTMLTEYGGREVRRGVEIDEFCAPLAYHFFTRPLNDVGGGVRGDSRRIPADRICQLNRQERPGQTHGAPEMVAALRDIRDLQEYQLWTLVAAKTQAGPALIISRASASEFPSTPTLANPEGDDGVDADNNVENIIQPAMVFTGEPGDEVKGMPPTQPGGNYTGYVQSLQEGIGAATDLSYGQVTRDHKRGTYSGQRQELASDNRVFRAWQKRLSLRLLRQVWEEFITLGVLDGRYSALAPDFFTNPLNYLRVEWSGAGMPWIDAHREIKASKEGLESGIFTHKMVDARQGVHWKAVMIQRKREQDFAEKIGLETGGGDKKNGQGQDEFEESKRDPDAEGLADIRRRNGTGGSSSVDFPLSNGVGV